MTREECSDIFSQRFSDIDDCRIDAEDSLDAISDTVHDIRGHLEGTDISDPVIDAKLITVLNHLEDMTEGLVVVHQHLSDICEALYSMDDL